MSCYEHPNSPSVYVLLHAKVEIIPMCKACHTAWYEDYEPFETKEEAETAAAIRELFKD